MELLSVDTTVNEAYWPALISHIRSTKKMSQEDFAEAVFSNQATVSRWEKGQVVPSFDKQKKIEKLAEGAGLSTLAGVAVVVRSSPFAMLLVDKDGLIMAASQSSGFQEGLNVRDQISIPEISNYTHFREELDRAEFWIEGGNQLVYEFSDQSTWSSSIVVSVGIRGSVFAVVQKIHT
jgi:transcriptional regulator with XRE-family HTH domain